MEWKASSSQKPSFATVDGKMCLNLDSTNFVEITPPSNYPRSVSITLNFIFGDRGQRILAGEHFIEEMKIT